MLFSRKTALWLAILPSTLAVDCTASNAVVYDVNSGGGGGGGGGGGSSGGSGSTCTNLCGNDSVCLGLCEPSGSGFRAIKGRNLNARATLTCTGNETCFSAEGELACIDLDTGYFHDETGGSGNLSTGEYTEGSAQATTIGAEGTTAPIASTAESTATSGPLPASPSTTGPSVPTSSNTDIPVNGTPTAGASGANTSAAATPTSGVDRLSGRGAVVGALGLLVGVLAN